MTDLVTKLQEAMQACEEISVKELNAQKEQIAEMFGQLQKAVYEIIDEKGIILANYNWRKRERIVDKNWEFDAIIDAEATKISAKTGHSKEVILDLLIIKNSFEWSVEFWNCKSRRYEFWTLVSSSPEIYSKE